MAQATAVKLGIIPGTTILVVGRPVSEALAILGELPEGTRAIGAVGSADAADAADLVLLFADEIVDVATKARDAFAKTDAAGRFWIAYRKGAKGRGVAPGEPDPLHRDTLQTTLAQLGLDGVTLIALDDAWSAMRVKAVRV